MRQDKKVKDYFKRAAEDFDNIYDNRGRIIERIANKLFRKGMRERFKLTLQLCSQSNNKTVLDIGCGAGRFLIPLAEREMTGVGIDYSEEMIKLAKEHLERYYDRTKRKLQIEYICCDFLNDFETDKSFDISLAIGVFDYLKEPLPFLKKMKSVTNEMMIASFPAKFALQVPIRKMWLITKKCPVYFYTKNRIKRLYSLTGISDYEIIKISAGYLVKSKI